jgi:ABC-type hemin transport system substrate-binding protein
MTAMVVGCDESPALNEDGDAGIASLSPAMTTIVQDLEAGDRLVGRTPWCRGVAHLPVVGALDGVDAEVLVQLRPAIVVHQPPAAEGSDPVLV